MWGRYVILRVLMECDGLVSITQTTGTDGQPDLVIGIDRTQIESVGLPAIGEFLKKLQVSMAFSLPFQQGLVLLSCSVGVQINS